MISSCPNCQQALNLTEAQQQKIEEAVAALSPGKTLKFACPQCKKPIELGPETAQEPEKKSAPLKYLLV